MIEDTQHTHTPTEPVLDVMNHKPIGSMNANDWKRAQHALQHAQSCDSAFLSIHRLIQEDPQRVTTEWLNRLVQQWMEQGTMPASQLLVKLSDVAPLPDTSTYDIIVAAIQKTSAINVPVGSMKECDWERAQAELTQLTCLESAVTQSRISSAWNILDRLLQEDKYGTEHVENYKSRLHPDWLNRIVEAWCKYPLDATEILVRINRYAPQITPDPYIYQMIVDTVSKETQNRGEQTTRHESPSPVNSSKQEESTAIRPRDNRQGATSAAPTVSSERSGHWPTCWSYYKTV